MNFRRWLMTVSVAIFISVGYGSSQPSAFHKAQPVWLEGRETEKNLLAGFRADVDFVDGDQGKVRIAASTVYRVFINGKFAGYGPARAAHGFYRIDECDISEHLLPGRNAVAIEVAGYNINSYAYLDQPSFVQAEVLINGVAVAATGDTGTFTGAQLTGRVAKVQRTSFQRSFSEAYRLNEASNNWRTSSAPFDTTGSVVLQDPKNIIARRAPYPEFQLKQPATIIKEGQIQVNRESTRFWGDRSAVNIGPNLKGFPREELEVEASRDIMQLETLTSRSVNTDYSANNALSMAADSYQVFDFNKELTGFIGANISCTTPTRVYLAFDEILTNGDVEPHRLGMVGLIPLDLQPGTHVFESMEPNSLRYLKVIAVGGNVELSNVQLREVANDNVWEAAFSCSDPVLNTVFEAGRETFRQNAVDIFMDCPSRERAGWLCDSFFTARAELRLSGAGNVEHDFLQNFVLPDEFKHLPKGMLPMCYPSDHNDGNFIPNWSMWFVLQLEEYLGRSNDSALVEAARPKVMSLFEYFKQFENEHGLLEKLQAWIFVEWSASNNYVQDVSYATNMLYAAALEAAGRLYSNQELTDKAARLKDTIRKMSFDGEFFVDNAVRENGKLVNTRNRSETCQYYAFYFDVATTASHPKLWEKLKDQFGPGSVRNEAMKDIGKSNAFMGNVMRFELLSRDGQTSAVLNNARTYYKPMADMTGTLWEHSEPAASCNHGFASHVIHLLYRDALGLTVDVVNRTVTVKLTDNGLNWCEGRHLTPDGNVSLSWYKDGSRFLYKCSAPAGYTIKIAQAPAGMEMVRQ